MPDSVVIQTFTEVHNQFKARLEQSTPQSIPDGNTLTVVDFDTLATYDPASLTTVGASAKITVGVNGYYQVNGRCALVSATYTDFWVAAYKNGSTSVAKGNRSVGTGPLASTVSDCIKLNAGDYLQLVVFQTSGGDRNTVAATDETYLSLSYLGSA